MDTAQHAADASAAKISALDHTPGNGAQAAYDGLQAEYNAYARTHQSAPELKDYWDRLGADLRKQSVLPDLGIAWGEQNFANVDFGGNAALSRADLKGAADIANSTNKPVDAILSQSLLAEFDLVRGCDNAITHSDLKSALAAQDNKNVDLSCIATLVGSKDGNADHTLFALMDSLPGGNKDGRIDQNDFQRYIKTYDAAAMAGLQPPGTAQDRQLAQSLNDHWNDADVRRLRSGGDGPITMDSLRQAGGFGSIEEMTKSEQSQSEKPPAPAEKAEHAKTTPKKDTPADHKRPQTKEEETSIVDTLAKNPQLLAQITGDSNHEFIDKRKVDEVLQGIATASADNQPTPYNYDEYKALKALDEKFSKLPGASGDIIGINTLTEDAFAGKQTFNDRLARDGNLPIDANDRAQVMQYLSQHGGVAIGLSDKGDGKEIDKDKVDQSYQWMKEHPENFTSDPQLADAMKVIKELHSSFFALSGGQNSLKIENRPPVELDKSKEAPAQPEPSKSDFC